MASPELGGRLHLAAYALPWLIWLRRRTRNPQIAGSIPTAAGLNGFEERRMCCAHTCWCPTGQSAVPELNLAAV